AKADTVASKRFEVAKNRYVIGKIGISDLFIAQNKKNQALTSYIQALRGFWTGYYRLRRVTLYDFAEKTELQKDGPKRADREERTEKSGPRRADREERTEKSGPRRADREQR